MKQVFAVSLVLCLVTSASHADQPDEEFFEPLALHHAHIENEFRLNMQLRENSRQESGDSESEYPEFHYRDVLESEAEIGWASMDRRMGVEAHIPFSNEGREDNGENIFGLGDIEIEPIRHSFIRRDRTVATASLGIVLPTGDARRGSGEGRTFVEPHGLIDHRSGLWSVSANIVPGFELGGDRERSLMCGLMLARTVPEGGRAEAALSIEIVSEWSFREAQDDLQSSRVIAGAHLPLMDGWRMRIGVGIPLSEDREEARSYLMQIGTHLE